MDYYFWTEPPFYFGIGLIIYALLKLREKSKYIPTEALCLKVTRTSFYGSVGPNRMGTYRYIFAGQEYIIQEKSDLNPKRLKKGGVYTLYVNPDNPRVFITEFQGKNYYYFIALGLLSIFLPLQRYFSY